MFSPEFHQQPVFLPERFFKELGIFFKLLHRLSLYIQKEISRIASYGDI